MVADVVVSAVLPVAERADGIVGILNLLFEVRRAGLLVLQQDGVVRGLRGMIVHRDQGHHVLAVDGEGHVGHGLVALGRVDLMQGILGVDLQTGDGLARGGGHPLAHGSARGACALKQLELRAGQQGAGVGEVRLGDGHMGGAVGDGHDALVHLDGGVGRAGGVSAPGAAVAGEGADDLDTVAIAVLHCVAVLIPHGLAIGQLIGRGQVTVAGNLLHHGKGGVQGQAGDGLLLARLQTEGGFAVGIKGHAVIGAGQRRAVLLHHGDGEIEQLVRVEGIAL